MTREPHIHTPAHDPVRAEDMAWAQAEAERLNALHPTKRYGDNSPEAVEAGERVIAYQARFLPEALLKNRKPAAKPMPDPLLYKPPPSRVGDLGTRDWWRRVLPKKPDWWDRVFATPWERDDG